MKKNLGSTDKIIRLLVAVAIGVLYFTGTVGGTLGIVLLVVAAIFFITPLINFCPLYSVLGISTKKKA